MILELSVQDKGYVFSSSIATALDQADSELQSITETIDSIKGLKPDCDKLDYFLAASSGAICGIIDIFLVGKPVESPVGDITDKWFANKTIDFAKLCGWKGEGEKSAISFLASDLSRIILSYLIFFLKCSDEDRLQSLRLGYR